MSLTPYTVNYKRAGDIFPPPQTGSNILNWDLKTKGVNALTDWLDAEKFTGVLKASSDHQKFRGAILLYAGWCVGALYAGLNQEAIKHTHKALPALLTQLNKDDSTQIQIYELPESIVLPFSSAFIGQFMEPAQTESPIQMAKYFIDHIKDLPRHSLITMKTLSESANELCLVYFFWGKISGYFLVERQEFSTDKVFPEFVLSDAIEAKIHLSILSPEIAGVYSGNARFGFPLIIE
ncbi:hypothetical protein KA183_17770 [bacterium]|nr:hypothetical protein [bacterium]QQR57360.1 MAG: hypothetical protein IPG59_20655 [Candidatus Melainabacteria bacterium]